ncbi:hypothetical protein FOQG_02376 [Fusarium oxysporum f. sp. raphani 54005]|uniref:Uncharacterized protein n=3 Tax=Fusarium oxysporum TaxID=5507 RepID=X0CRF7_FUSOX|nr:hypothetical protein FOVG_07421 [Fusarium oxysporum f. sp. pisi HDV247]EXK97030.1 hypothetical protein FOQG_02376 [Fusarium oxysporum f. sp. raphani 54005]EXL71544.1 hypothetical protein FOPG_12697 [Fusarium oxysporum f. sp. conglutinans race 2 54008]
MRTRQGSRVPERGGGTHSQLVRAVQGEGGEGERLG